MAKTIITVRFEQMGEDAFLILPDELVKQMGWGVNDMIKCDVRNKMLIIQKEEV